MAGRLLRLLLLAVVGVAFLAVASPAWADSLVYIKSSGGTGDVWISNSDGTGQRQVTHGGGYAWPSEADNGTIVALGPGKTAPDGTQGMDIYKMDQSGHLIGSRIPTHSDYSNGNCPAYPPNNMRVSPDGTKIAYDEFICSNFATYWTPSNSTGLNFPNQTLGQEDYGDPAWMGNSGLLLSYVGVPFNLNDTFATYATGGGDNSSRGWFGDTTESDPSNPGGWATGFNATISRQGDKIAILEDDAANWFDGTPRNVALRFFTTNGTPPAQPTFRCQLNLPASRFPSGGSNNGLSFSPDGTKIAWEDTAGIHVANIGNLSNCSAITQKLLIPGAIDPFWSAANELTPVTLTRPSARFQLARSFTVAWGGSGPYDVRYRKAAFNGSFSSYVTWKNATSLRSATFNGTPGYSYCFQARRHGSVTWSAQKCTSVPLDDRSLAASKFVRKTGAGYYLGTYSLATAKGAKLTRTGVRGRYLAVIATTAPQGGTIGVSFNGVSLGQKRLVSSTAHKEHEFLFNLGTVKSGTLSVQVLSSGKHVEIDGLGVSQN